MSNAAREVLGMKTKKSKRSAKRSKVVRRARPKAAGVRNAAAKKRKRNATAWTSASKKPVKRAAKKSPPTKKRGRAASVAPKPSAKARQQKPRRSLLPPKARRRRSDDADAFLRVRRDGERTKDDLAQELGEDFVGSATSGEDQGLALRDTVLDEESGGPFVTTPAKREFAEGFDASNPEDALREPFPSAQSQPDP
jgi:hypothetical protein